MKPAFQEVVLPGGKIVRRPNAAMKKVIAEALVAAGKKSADLSRREP